MIFLVGLDKLLSSKSLNKIIQLNKWFFNKCKKVKYTMNIQNECKIRNKAN
jgi:hypothetical protein